MLSRGSDQRSNYEKLVGQEQEPGHIRRIQYFSLMVMVVAERFACIQVDLAKDKQYKFHGGVRRRLFCDIVTVQLIRNLTVNAQDSRTGYFRMRRGKKTKKCPGIFVWRNADKKPCDGILMLKKGRRRIIVNETGEWLSSDGNLSKLFALKIE